MAMTRQPVPDMHAADGAELVKAEREKDGEHADAQLGSYAAKLAASRKKLKKVHPQHCSVALASPAGLLLIRCAAPTGGNASHSDAEQSREHRAHARTTASQRKELQR
jgi:hypothetical protein